MLKCVGVVNVVDFVWARISFKIDLFFRNFDEYDIACFGNFIGNNK